jgi:hypothetical protein
MCLRDKERSSMEKGAASGKKGLTLTVPSL